MGLLNWNKEDILVTTAYSFASREIDHEIDIISSEYVAATSFSQDMKARMDDVIGGKSRTYEKVFRECKEGALKGLKKEAKKIGADGVIGVSLNYDEISGKKKSMLFLIVSGTAVKLKDVK